MSYTLYGSQASYFTAKARAYLRWRGVSYHEQAVSGELMQQRLLPTIGWPVVPVLELADGSLVQDTEDIIAAVEARTSGPRALPAQGLQRVVSLLLQLFADEWLTLPAMHYRWNMNEQWIYGEFGRSSAPDASAAEQHTLGERIGARFKGFVPMLGVTAQTIPGIEASYEQFLADFSAHLAEHPFVLGGRASYGDFALVGPLFAHLLRDPASGELMQRLAPQVVDWTQRVHGGNGQLGALLQDDAVPMTLQPILRRHLADHWPVLEETAQRCAHWSRSAEPGAELPRGFDTLSFTVGGCDGEAAARSFPLYRLQAVLDAIAALVGDERERAAAWLAACDAQALLDWRLPVRLERRRYRLCLAR
ncbi:MAG: glutathione S-transferase N-terminal domain-containing protein [Pseudomonadota bacterium]